MTTTRGSAARGDPPPPASVIGIVLAAGRSRRVGRPKALLELEGRTFLERIVSALLDGGCAGVRVVAPLEPAGIAAAGRSSGAEVVLNPAAGAEQIDSLRLGLEGVPGSVAAAVVCPVDVPAVGPGVVHALIEAFERTGAPIVRVVHDGRHGHPVLFARRVFPELREAVLREGARDVIRRHGPEVLDVEVAEKGVLLDVDTPADLARLREERG